MQWKVRLDEILRDARTAVLEIRIVEIRGVRRIGLGRVSLPKQYTWREGHPLHHLMRTASRHWLEQSVFPNFEISILRFRVI